MTAPLQPALAATASVVPLRDTRGAVAAVTEVPAAPLRPLAQVLLAEGLAEPADLLAALRQEARSEAQLADILLAQGMIDEPALLAGLAAQWRLEAADLELAPPDPRLVSRLGAETCLAEAVLPWKRAGGLTVIASARPWEFRALRPRLEALFGPVAMALTTRPALEAALCASQAGALRARAETRTPEAASCRGRLLLDLRRGLVLAGAGLALAALLAPLAVLAGLALWSVAMLIAGTGLRVAAALAARRAHAEAARGRWERPRPAIARLPVVSLLVALHGEEDVAPRLVRRLDRLAYPHELLDVILVVEADDGAPRAALAAADLPRWMRVLTVPRGTLCTKPRALNYALDFARGGIIGIYDAEDAPPPDQIHRVVQRFHERGAEVACLQGMLDHYNARANWIARCFAVEYASWFRMVLPGLARLGFAVPLGGTTVFFRRDALEAVGAWDAHNVTEDADLGIRLARAGYRTELIDSITEEEAACTPLPWIRQRSRWIKGYAITYATHMRDPARLWRDLGPRRFAGFQILFLSTLTQAALAPVLWSFWLLLLGLGHPLAPWLGWPALLALTVLFLTAEAANIAIGWAATSQLARHRHLRVWVPTLHFYHPLASLAGAKAVWELVTRPLYWDKTDHGRFDLAAPAPTVFAGRRSRRLRSGEPGAGAAAQGRPDPAPEAEPATAPPLPERASPRLATRG